MATSRRRFLAALGSAGGLSLLPRRLRAATADDEVFPHAPRRPGPAPGRLVLSHWHVFPISYDNRPESADRYTRDYLVAGAGRPGSLAGVLRDRPIPRQPILQRDWPVRDAESDVALARNAGVDAFQYNIGSFDPNSAGMRYIGPLLEAVTRSGADFRIVPSLDCHSLGSSPSLDAVLQSFLPLLGHPAALRMPGDGRVMLSCFRAENWSATFWSQLLAAFAARGLPIYFAPIFLNPAGQGGIFVLADMVGRWAGTFPEAVGDIGRFAAQARAQGKAVMWSVWPQDCRFKDGWYAEARGSETFRSSWEAAIPFNPECVNVMTWNDYSESSQMRPSVGVQYAFADLNRFYSDWYKSGAKPAIVRDVLYYFHRRDFTGADKAIDPSRPAMRMRYGRAPVDEVELVGFLTAPGTLRINSDAGKYGFDVGAGISVVRAPLAAGRLAFRLDRGGGTVLATESPFLVRPRWDWQDLTYRGGSSSRAPVDGTQAFGKQND